MGQGRRLHWLEAGGGEPCVVLDAGFSDTALAWAEVLATLACQTRVIAYDRAGLGNSDADPLLLVTRLTVEVVDRLRAGWPTPHQPGMSSIG